MPEHVGIGEAFGTASPCLERWIQRTDEAWSGDPLAAAKLAALNFMGADGPICAVCALPVELCDVGSCAAACEAVGDQVPLADARRGAVSALG